MALPEIFYHIFTWVFGIFLVIALLSFLIYWFFIHPKNYFSKNKDMQIYVTKENRFELGFAQIKGSEGKKFEYGGENYFVIDKCQLLNRNGKTLGIYSKGKPQPLQISYNESKWLDNQSINSILNNELIPKLLQPNIGWRDILLVLVTITSIGAFICVILIALKVFNVIKGNTQTVQIQAGQYQIIK